MECLFLASSSPWLYPHDALFYQSLARLFVTLTRVCLQAHLLLTLSLVCGAGAFWAEGNRLFSADNNYRNDFNGRAAPVEAVPEDWRMDPYWGAWLLGEWVGLLITGILVIVYYTISPFFINHGRLFRKSNESYEVR